MIQYTVGSIIFHVFFFCCVIDKLNHFAYVSLKRDHVHSDSVKRRNLDKATITSLSRRTLLHGVRSDLGWLSI